MKFKSVLKPFAAVAACVCTAFGGADAATGSGGGTAVSVTVKDWTGKVVTTVRGVTFDGNFKLDTADHFNGKVDYVTAFDGGTVVKNGTNSERASSSVVNYSGITGESFATEVFVQPYVPTAAGYGIADPFGVKAPNENRWVFTGTTGSSIKLASLTSFPTALTALTLWSAKDVSNFADGYSSAVWAPEILYVRGNWYVYFSASSSSDTNKERSFVMSYKGSSSSGLTTKANWNTATRIVTPDDKWAIDGTVFEGKDGNLYYVWSGWAGNSNVRQDIYLAPMETPTTIAPGAKRTLVSIPDQDWETKPTDHPLVEEGPAVLQKGDKTIIVFSGNGSWKQYYSLGYTVCSDGNYTNAESWKKHEGTVFTKRSYAYGPGHCSFTKDANGQDYIIYHATATATAPSGSDYWSIRNARVQPFAWHDDEPVFGAPRPTSGDGLAPAGESYSVTKSWTKAGSADKTFVHAPTAETVTGKVGSTVSPTFLANDYFTVSGTTSLSESKTVTLTLALKDASTTAWDDGTTGSKTCKFTAELTGEPPSVDAVAFDAKFVDGYVLNWGVENTLTGTATPGKAVRVWYDDGNGYPMLEETVTASAAGVWSVTFVPPAKEATAHPIHAECGTARATFSAIPNGGTGPEQEEPQDAYALELPTIFANDMVLQRDRAVLVWGRVTGGKTVTVTLKKSGAAIRTATAVARADGVWEAQLCSAANALAASTDAHTLEVTCPGETAKTFTNVRIGDVWVCAGQSNMAFWIGEEVHYADYKAYFQSCGLRVFAPNTSLQAATDYWQNLGSYDKGLSKSWSALACYFLRDIMLSHPEVPQMLISAGVGASYSTRWFPPKALARIGSVPAKYPAGDLWNMKLSALTRFTVRGVLWHQGEADSAGIINDQRFANYDDKLTIIAEEWRRAWGHGAAVDGDGVKAEDMAFYWFDLAMDHYGNDLFSDDPSGAKDSKCQGWWQALNRCAQFAALEKIANGGLAVTYDFGHPRDIHPPCKKPVGERLARWARRDIYGESDLVVSGPLVTGVATDGDALVLTFAPNTAKGLKAGYKACPTEKDLPQFFEISDAHPVSGFAISADGKNWAWAKVAVVGDPSGDQQIRLTADGIAAPKYVHHNYLVQPCGDWQETDGVYTYDGSYLNLYNSDGLPCPAFATIDTDWSFTVGAGTGAIDDPHQPAPPGHTHVWGEWTMEESPTCTTAGRERRVCTAEGCNDPVSSETRPIVALGHHLVADPDSDREATCEHTGISGSQKCDRAGCTHKVAGTVIPKVDHVYVNGKCQWCHRDEPELPSGDVTTGAIPGHADWGYVNTYTLGGTICAAYVYTNVTAAMSFTVPDGVTVLDYLVVAGGGAGGINGGVCGGGGGAGGLLTSMGDTPAPVSVTPGDVFTLSVGAGGEPGVAGSNGKAGNGFDSVVAKGGVDVVRAIGGGTGGSFKSGGTAGGSGGGAGWQGGSGGSGVDGQGFAGGKYGGKNGAGGGGGAKETGKSADGNDGAAGGDGLEFSITGEFLAYAAGGGGGGYVASGTGPVGGAGGSNGIGGTGGAVGGNGTAGQDGTGSGGGGAGKNGLPGKGGSGVVVIRCATTGENPPEPPPAGHTHVWSAWTETTAATCEKAGVETRTCTAEGCSDPVATETQTIPALGHHLVADPDSDRAATCSETGISGSQKCDRAGCTHKVAGTVIAKVDHVYVNGECQWCHQAEPELPSGDVESGPIPGHGDWGYVNAYKRGGTAYAAYVYTNVTAVMTFTVPADVTAIDYFVVAGGGAGGRYLSGVVAGGGGAGGLLQGSGFAVSAGDTLTLTVGKGGVQNVNGEGRTQANSPGEDKFKGIASTVCNGFDSVVTRGGVELLRAYGGAGGGAKGATKRGGGSGGGTGAGTTAYVAMPGTEGQGHDGGARESAFANCSGATGGGGAGSAGGALTDASSKDGTNGGEGLQSSITGELLWYAAGGGGAAVAGGTHGKGGNGIGGDGAATGTSGVDGTGSGGGGSSTNGTKGGDGGSGVIVIRFKTAGDDPEPAKPTVDGKAVEPAAVFETATSAKPIVYPSAPTLAGEIGAQTIAFGGVTVGVPVYYTATLTDSTVTLALNDNARPVIADTDATKAFELTAGGKVSLHIGNTYPALYYALATSASLADGWTVGEFAKGQAEFTATRGDAPTRFYRVFVSDTPTP